MKLYVDRTHESICLSGEEGGESFCGTASCCDQPLREVQYGSVWHLVVDEDGIHDDECMAALADALGFHDVMALKHHARRQVQRSEDTEAEV